MYAKKALHMLAGISIKAIPLNKIVPASQEVVVGQACHIRRKKWVLVLEKQCQIEPPQQKLNTQ